MKNPLYQKIFFTETYIDYPRLTYNEILLNFWEYYEIEKIIFTPNQFNVFKSNHNKKKFFNNNIYQKLDNIKLHGKNLLKCKMDYIDIKNRDIKKNFRIFDTSYSLGLLHIKDISQYFTDYTYKCIPSDLIDINALLILIGYNHRLDKFQLVLIALLSNEDTDIFRELYNFLKNTYLFKPNKISFVFGLANLKGIQNVYSEEDYITIIPCLFHLTQAWWRKASKLGLRKKKYILTISCLLFNLELLAFMNLN